MAYRCVLAPSFECDGCMECKEHEEELASREERMRWDKWEYEYDYYRDECLIRELEREER